MTFEFRIVPRLSCCIYTLELLGNEMKNCFHSG